MVNLIKISKENTLNVKFAYILYETLTLPHFDKYLNLNRILLIE